MGLKKDGVKKGDYRLQESGLFGMIDNIPTADQIEDARGNIPVSLNHDVGKQALVSVLEAEYWKAKAIMVIHQNFCK